MSIFTRLVLPITVAVALVGCASKPTDEALRAVADAERQYSQIANDPMIAREAPQEKEKAEKYLREAQEYTDKRGKNEEMLQLSELSTTWSQAAIARMESAEANEDLDQVLSAENALVRDGAEVTSRGLMLHNWAVHFKVGEHALLPEETTNLDELAGLLQRHPEVMLLVEGHADVTGSEAYNLDLSTKRAGTVIDYLLGQGADANRLKGVGYGSALPRATNATPKGREVNRRVTFVLGHKEMPPVFMHEEVKVEEVMEEAE